MSTSQESSTTSLLKGKLYPGYNSPVVRVTKENGKRIVHLQNGSEIRTTKSTIKEFAHGIINERYRVGALRSIREQPDGTVKATIGGPIKGERKLYATKAAALTQISKHYGKGSK